MLGGPDRVMQAAIDATGIEAGHIVRIAGASRVTEAQVAQVRAASDQARLQEES